MNMSWSQSMLVGRYNYLITADHWTPITDSVRQYTNCSTTKSSVLHNGMEYANRLHHLFVFHLLAFKPDCETPDVMIEFKFFLCSTNARILLNQQTHRSQRSAVLTLLNADMSALPRAQNKLWQRCLWMLRDLWFGVSHNSRNITPVLKN